MDENTKTILQLVEDGKITTDEAIKLMEAVKKSQSSGISDKVDDIAGYIKEKAPAVKSTAIDAAHKVGSFLNDFIDSVKERKSSANYNDYVKDVRIIEPSDSFDTVGEAPDTTEEIKAKLKDAANEIKVTADCAADEIKDRVKAAAEKHSETAEKAINIKNTVCVETAEAVEAAKDAANTAKNIAKDKINEVKAKAEDKSDKAKETADDTLNTVEEASEKAEKDNK